MPVDPQGGESNQSFMERLVTWYELGTILERRGLIAAETLEAHREAVRTGRSRNLFEALEASNTLGYSVLYAAFEEGHIEVSCAFLAMKQKLVTMQQLYTLFAQVEREHRSLRDVMREHGITPPDPPWPGGSGPKTPSPIMPRPGLPGGEAVG